MITEHFFPDGVPGDLRAYGLVMPQGVRDSLLDKQAAHGNPRHRLSPVALTDGRWALSADVLTEAREGGLFGSVAHLDPAQVAQVVVAPWADVLALIRRPVNINEDDAETLAARLPGVGPALAAQIVAGRPWADVRDLSDVSGVSDEMVTAWQDNPGLVL